LHRVVVGMLVGAGILLLGRFILIGRGDSPDPELRDKAGATSWDHAASSPPPNSQEFSVPLTPYDGVNCGYFPFRVPEAPSAQR
jgi:hypothetical protein